MRFMFLFVCVLALVASVYTMPCWDYSCSGSGSSGGFAEQYSYSASGQRSQGGYDGGNYDNGGLFGGSGGYTRDGGQRTGGGSGYGNRRQRNCPTCGVSNFGNGNHNQNKITVRRNYG
ncbi:unnamed protein product [Danaus chrysippus]|uniref:(African queen) hypothetical protein n=1 Tax=Danaus chrysippus TaxID=151541 RepID=A0A8J2QZ02_9NEOP|nr:unnamed protein product [Danaus chrysippus]